MGGYLVGFWRVKQDLMSRLIMIKMISCWEMDLILRFEPLVF